MLTLVADKSNHILLSGVGISQGSEYFIAEDGKIFGMCFDQGFILGEDTVVLILWILVVLYCLS